MKEYKSKDIRNLALIGHSSSGKTTLTEAMLFSSGAINRQGSIDEGTTTSDYRNDEKERKISLQSSLNQFEFNDIKMNVLDRSRDRTSLGICQGTEFGYSLGR